jgi:hypothetical protein
LYSDLYSSLRFNIYLGGNAYLDASDIRTDTAGSYWIYNNGLGKIDGDESISRSPLFIPSITDVNCELSSGNYIVVNIIGTMLYSCNLLANFILKNRSEITESAPFVVSSYTENHAFVNISKNLLDRPGEYYIYFSYGTNNLLRTETFWFYNTSVDGSNENVDNSSKGSSGSSMVMILIIILAVLVVAFVIMISVFIIVYRRKRSGVGKGGLKGSKKYGKRFMKGFSEHGGKEPEEEFEKEGEEDYGEYYDEDQEERLLGEDGGEYSLSYVI